ncbi:MAG: response regulator [Sphingobacteriales bacterium]|nr:MAG: response regulator [Sphingobacteriales bacterium]
MVLLVDDKPENLLSLKTVLELNKFEVDTASSGEEALQKVLKQSYALIILDVQMPGMDGFEVAEAISGYSRTRNIPIIFLSAVSTDKKFITKGYESGAIDYVTKPVDPDILILKVKTFNKLYEQTHELIRIQKSLNEEVAVRKKTEAALQETVTQLHSFIESLPQIAFTTNAAGEVDEVNHHWFRYSRSVNILPVTHPADQPLAEAMNESIARGKSMELEVRIKELDAPDYKYHLLKVLPVRDDQGTVIKWVGTFTDIHSQKAAAETLEKRVNERTAELLKTNLELEARNLELQQFTSVASHDLKEPLRKIQVFSSIVMNKLSESTPEATADYLSRIVSASERMSVLINDLLTYSRLSVNSLFQPTDLNMLVQEILVDLEIQIREKNAVIHTGRLDVIDAIPGQIRQLFQNIISNALKFSRPGTQPEISIYCERVAGLSSHAHTEASGEFTRITISDNGIGFDERYLDKIFTLFQRLNSRENYEGTGIGLAIAKKIVDKHEGTITARSKEKQGSDFIIILPVKHIEAELTESANTN